MRDPRFKERPIPLLFVGVGEGIDDLRPSSRKSSPRRWLVSFSSVAKRYPGGQEALKSVTFSIDAGELAFVTGRSGAGKSTLLKLIAAIERPTSGSVIVNGQNVGALKRTAVPYLGATSGSCFRTRSCSTTAACSTT